ncbi:MAG: hypothetical protein IPJ34_19315 [Myxococcales bacterium]|nr:hypothetical protein [Myxococcales bacterium]
MVASDWAWLSVVLVCGCSSTTNITNANCGPGTVLKDGVCVAADVDAGDDSVVVDSSAPEDAAVESGSDALVDTSTADGETGPVTHPDDDPCPTGLKFPLTPERTQELLGHMRREEAAGVRHVLPASEHQGVHFRRPRTGHGCVHPAAGPSKMCKEPCGSSGIAASVQVQRLGSFGVPAAPGEAPAVAVHHRHAPAAGRFMHTRSCWLLPIRAA